MKIKKSVCRQCSTKYSAVPELFPENNVCDFIAELYKQLHNTMI